MRAIVRIISAAALMAALLGPGLAQALLNAQCGDYYSGTTSCMFTSVGNIYVNGHTTGDSIRIRVSDPTGTVTIFECVGQRECSSQVGLPSTGTDSVGPPQGVGPLLCTVITTGSGYYRCQSNV